MRRQSEAPEEAAEAAMRSAGMAMAAAMAEKTTSLAAMAALIERY